MSSLKRNIIYQISYQVLLVILPLLTSPYLARVIGKEGEGEYAFYYSIAYYFSLFILLGVSNHGTREIAKVKGDKKRTSEVFWSIYLVQLAMGVIVLAAYFITQVQMRAENSLSAILLLYVLSAVLDINWLLFGLEQFKLTVTRNLVIKIATVSSIFLFVKTKNDVGLYTVIMSAGFLASQIVLWPFAKKEIIFTRVSFKSIILNVKPMLTLFIPVVAASIYKYMDKIMLGAMYNKGELGLYENTEKIMSIPSGVIIAVGTVMLPRITNMLTQTDGEEKAQKYLSMSLSGSMILATALAFGLAAISSSFSVWFWGEEFTQCGDLIKAIAPTVLFLAWANAIRMQYLIPLNKESIFIRATVYGAVINFVINYLLIPRFGAMGTVIGTVAAEFAVAFYQTFAVRRELPIKRYVRESIPYVFFGLIMYGCVMLIDRIHLMVFPRLVIEIIAGALVYAILLFIFIIVAKKISIRDILSFLTGKTKQ